MKVIEMVGEEIIHLGNPAMFPGVFGTVKKIEFLLLYEHVIHMTRSYLAEFIKKLFHTWLLVDFIT